MPTPTGMLRKGDRLLDGKTVLVVVERLGNDMIYSVRVRREDGSAFPNGRAEGLITEVSYWLQHGLTILDEAEPIDVQLDAVKQAAAEYVERLRAQVLRIVEDHTVSVDLVRERMTAKVNEAFDDHGPGCDGPFNCTCFRSAVSS